MSTSHRATRALAAVLVGAGALTACGSTGTNGVAGKSTSQIVDTSRAAVAAASSVHIKGNLGTGGDTILLDMTLVRGRGATGSVVINQQTIQLLRLGQDIYVKGDAAFYHSVVAGIGATAPTAPAGPGASTAPATPATPAKGGATKPAPTAAATPAPTAATTGSDITVNAMQVNFLHIVPGEPAYQTFASLTDPASLVDQILAGTGSLEKDGQKDIRGAKTIVLTGATHTKVYVGIDGPAYLLRVLPAGGGSLDFLDYGAQVTLTAPPPNQVVDISAIPR